MKRKRSDVEPGKIFAESFKSPTVIPGLESRTPTPQDDEESQEDENDKNEENENESSDDDLSDPESDEETKEPPRKKAKTETKSKVETKTKTKVDPKTKTKAETKKVEKKKKETKMSFFGGRQVEDDEKKDKKRKKLKIKERLAPIIVTEGFEVVIPKSLHGSDEPYNDAIKNYYVDFNHPDADVQRKECIYKGYALVAHTRKGKDFYRVIKAIKSGNRNSTIIFDEKGMISSNLDISKGVVTQTQTFKSIFSEGDSYYCGDKQLPMMFDMKTLVAKIEPVTKGEGTLTLLVAGDDKNCLHIHIKLDDGRHLQFEEPQIGDDEDKENSKIIDELVNKSKRPAKYICKLPTAFLEQNLKILKPCVDMEDCIQIDVPRGGLMKFIVSRQSISVQDSVLPGKIKRLKKKSDDSDDDDDSKKESADDLSERKIEIIPFSEDKKHHSPFSDKFSFKLLWGIVNALKVKQYPIHLRLVEISDSISHLVLEQQLSEDSKITQRFPCKANHAQEAAKG